MNFELRVKNLPAGTDWWYGIWYVPPAQWATGRKLPASKTFTFTGVAAGPGYLYADAYDSADVRLTDGQSRGTITPTEGSIWEYDFSTGVLYQITGPAPTPSGVAISAISAVPSPLLRGQSATITVSGSVVGAFTGHVELYLLQPTDYTTYVSSKLTSNEAWAVGVFSKSIALSVEATNSLGMNRLQAVIEDAVGNVLANETVDIQVSEVEGVTILDQVWPLVGLTLVMAIMVPMMKGLGGAFKK